VPHPNPARSPGLSSPRVTEELDRELGLGGAVALGVGTMIAAGIFVLSGLAVATVGAAAVVAFLIAAAVAAFTAAAYAEFAAIYPESGGGYMYVANVFDSELTYLVGWAMILGYPASAAFYLASFSDWFYRFLYPALDLPEAIPYWVSGMVLLALLVAVNVKGTRETGLFQVIVTTLKVILIGVFLYGGLRAFDGHVVMTSLQANLHDLPRLGVTSALVFITFFGFEAIATNAEEIQRPGVTIPRAIFISMGLVTAIYVLVVLVIAVAVHDGAFLDFLAAKAGLGSTEAARRFVAENGEVSMGRAAQYYLGNVGFYVVIVGALLSMVSAANATIMAGSRVKLAMARRRHLPSAIESVHPRFRTPHRAVLMTGGLILCFIVVFTVLFGEIPGRGSTGEGSVLELGIEAVAHFADFMLLSGLIFVNLAVVRSRREAPELERPFRVPLVPWVPLAAVAANLVLLINVERVSLVLGFMALGAGAIFWFVWKSMPPSAEELEAATPTALAEYRSGRRGHRLMVALGNPEHADWLMGTATALARDRGQDLLVMSAVIVPEQTPPSEGRYQGAQNREVLERALALAEEAGLAADGIIRIAHRAPDAILNTIVQHEPDAVLLGWDGRKPRAQGLFFGSIVDRVLTEAPCDVFVETAGSGRVSETESVLLPTAGGPHGDLALAAAAAVARASGGRVVPVTVIPPAASGEERRLARDFVAGIVGRLGATAGEPLLLEDDDVAAALIAESARHDLVVLGATRESRLQQLAVGAIPYAVAGASDTPVLMVRGRPGMASRLLRRLPWP
jgi:APA family basic amino acid/polyamine antiporter